MRLRKTVIVIDLSDGGAAAQIAVLARRLGVLVTQIGALDGDVADAMGRAIRSRRVVIAAAGRPESARQAARNLTGVLAGLRDLGLRGDCLAWLAGCDRVDLPSVTGLLELGPATGTSILLSTTSMTCAASLAPHVATRIECGHGPSPAAFTLISARRPDASTSGLLVPIALGQAR